MNSLGSCINTFGRYKKVNPKNELGELLIFLLLTTLHFGKDLNLLQSAKCSVSTQLTYIQNKYSITSFQSVQSGILQGQSLKLLKYLLTLEYFVNSEIFCNFLGFLDSWISCHFGFFHHFWYQFANFYKTKIGL